MWKILSCVNPDRDFHVHILESKTHQILTERFSSFLSSDSSFHELEKVTTLWLNLNLFCKNRVLSSVWFFVYIAIYQVFENSKSEYVREENKYARKFVRANISTNKVSKFQQTKQPHWTPHGSEEVSCGTVLSRTHELFSFSDYIIFKGNSVA